MMHFWKQESCAILIGAFGGLGLTIGYFNLYRAPFGPAEKFVAALSLVLFFIWMLTDIRRKHL